MSALANNNRIILLFGGVLALAVAIIYVTPKFDMRGTALDYLPAFNASINALVSLMLIIGFLLIRNKKINAHRRVMTICILLSVIFLMSYVTYHLTHPSTSYGGEGLMRAVYFFVLITHIVLAAIIAPMVLITFVHALSEKFDKHRTIARWTLPLWLYVSITGVVVYLMISPYYS